jgi:ABC-type multidrug transport system permease subunit
MFIAIFYGIQIIWERDAGVLTKLLVTPTPRAALITGKAFAAGVKAVVQVPGWLRAISAVNPLSYQDNALRGLLLGTPSNPWQDFAILIVAAVLGIIAASSLLGRLAR